MSRSTCSSSLANKKLDERNLKFLRELVALPNNKQCFDCQQRGPTYVNATAGSFVCTSCSGRLRGLNPPHRVKSISMATFSNDEIEFIKSRGNDYCRKVWMGKYDKSRVSIDESSFKDETQMRDFLALKYEKKRWYVNPNEIQFNSPNLDTSVVNNNHESSINNNENNNSIVKIGVLTNINRDNGHHTTSAASFLGPHTMTSSLDTSPKPKSIRDGISPNNLPSDLFGSPLNSPHLNNVQQQTTFNANFANFDAFSNGSLRPAPVFDDFGASSLPKSVTLPAMPMPIATAAPPSVQPMTSGSVDKYSALKELDELFSGTPNNCSTITAGNAPPVAAVQWGAASGSRALNATAQNVPAANPFFGSSPTCTVGWPNANLAPVPFGADSSNPFGDKNAISTPPTFNPFAITTPSLGGATSLQNQQQPVRPFVWGSPNAADPVPSNPFAVAPSNSQMGPTKTWNPFTN